VILALFIAFRVIENGAIWKTSSHRMGIAQRLGLIPHPGGVVEADGVLVVDSLIVQVEDPAVPPIVTVENKPDVLLMIGILIPAEHHRHGHLVSSWCLLRGMELEQEVP